MPAPDGAGALAVRAIDTTVVASQQISETGYVLQLERHDLAFQAGMLLTIHSEDPTEDRDYTMCSGIEDDPIEILYRYIPTGRLTSRLVKLRPGDPVRFSAPYGRFTIQDPNRPLVFVATGTGIAPCRSYVRSHPDLDLTVLHGVRTQQDLFYADEFSPYTFHPCVSRGAPGTFTGRVTERLAGVSLPAEAHYYLCGAYEMIFDVSNLLQERGVDPGDIFTEAYYYKAGV